MIYKNDHINYIILNNISDKKITTILQNRGQILQNHNKYSVYNDIVNLL